MIRSDLMIRMTGQLLSGPYALLGCNQSNNFNRGTKRGRNLATQFSGRRPLIMPNRASGFKALDRIGQLAFWLNTGRPDEYIDLESLPIGPAGYFKIFHAIKSL